MRNSSHIEGRTKLDSSGSSSGQAAGADAETGGGSGAGGVDAAGAGSLVGASTETPPSAIAGGPSATGRSAGASSRVICQSTTAKIAAIAAIQSHPHRRRAPGMRDRRAVGSAAPIEAASALDVPSTDLQRSPR